MYKRSIKTGRIRRYRKTKVYTLSGGQQQRVALARVIIKDAPIILCDEPTGSLDKDNAQDIINIFKGNENAALDCLLSHMISP